jgi:hypothetical protein
MILVVCGGVGRLAGSRGVDVDRAEVKERTGERRGR